MADNEQLQDDLENQAAADQAEELEFLKQTAKQLGIKFSNNIGLEALSEKISIHQAEAAEAAKAEAEAKAQSQAKSAAPLVPGTARHDAALRRVLMADAMKLVRVRINNLDPKKNELKGEIITVGNDYIGHVRKMVPFGKATDAGYHIPWILYKYLKNKTYLVVRSTVHPQTKQIITETSYEREFAVELLDPLSKEEIKALADRQLAAGSAE